MIENDKQLSRADRFFGILIFIYVLLYVYLYIPPYTMYVNYFVLALLFSSLFNKIVVGKDKIKINVSIIFFLFFLAWGYLSVLWAEDEDLAISYHSRIIFLFIISVLFHNFLKLYKINLFFLYGIICGGILNFLVYLNIMPYTIGEISGRRFFGTMQNPNNLSIFMALSIFSSIVLVSYMVNKENKYLKWALYSNILMSLFLIVQTGSKKGVLLGISFLSLFYLPYIKSVKGGVTVAAFLIILLFGFNYLLENEDFANQMGLVSDRFDELHGTIEGSGGDDDIRVEFINIAYDLWKDNPFVGIGLNNFRQYAGGYYAHSNFAAIGSELGIVGLIFYYMFFLFCALSTLKIKDKSLKMSALFFFVVFFAMDFAWISYTDTIYVMYLIMLSNIALLYNKSANIGENHENSNTSF